MSLHQPVFPSALFPNTPGDPLPPREPFYWQVPHLPEMDLPGPVPELEGFASLEMLAAFGQDPSAEVDTDPAPAPAPAPAPTVKQMRAEDYAGYAIIGLSVAVSAYHGYKSNDESATAALGWGLLGLFFPIVTPIFALTQGFAKPSEGTLIRRMAANQGLADLDDQPFPPYDPSKRIVYNPIPRSGYKGSSFQ